MEPLLLILGVLFGCMIISFLLSGMEAGVFALSPLRIRKLKRTGNRRAALLLDYLQKPEHFLWTILVGNTLANFIAFAVVADLLQQLLKQSWGLCLILYLISAFVFYTLCELLPKIVFRLFPNRLSLFFVRPFRLIHGLLRPLVACVSGCSKLLSGGETAHAIGRHLSGNREEVRFLMQQSAQTLTTEERSLISRVLDLQNVRVRHLARPLDHMISVSENDPVSTVLALCQEHNLNRLPVWQENPKRIAGTISLDSVIHQSNPDKDMPVKRFMRSTLFLNEEMPIEEALRRMQRSGRKLAVVLGPDQRERGILSFQDILKLIFGEVKL